MLPTFASAAFHRLPTPSTAYPSKVILHRHSCGSCGSCGSAVVVYPLNPLELSPPGPQGDDDLLSDEESAYFDRARTPFDLAASDDDNDDGYGVGGDDVFAKMNSAWAAREGRLNESVAIGSLNDNLDEAADPEPEASDHDPDPAAAAAADDAADAPPDILSMPEANDTAAATAAATTGADDSHSNGHANGVGVVGGGGGDRDEDAEEEQEEQGEEQERMPDVGEVVAKLESTSGGFDNPDNVATAAHRDFLTQYAVQEGERAAARAGEVAELAAATTAGTGKNAAKAEAQRRRLEADHAASLARAEAEAEALRQELEEERAAEAAEEAAVGPG